MNRLIFFLKSILNSVFCIKKVPNFCWDLPGISEDMYRLAVSLIQNMKAISSDPNAYEPDESSKLSSVLIFLPGIYEIGQMRNYLIEHIQS